MVKALQSCGRTYGGLLAVPWAPKSYTWPCKPCPRVPWGEGGPFTHCCAGLNALWLLRGLFLN